MKPYHKSVLLVLAVTAIFSLISAGCKTAEPPNLSEQALPWYNEGITLVKLSQYNEAIKSFNKAIEIYPQYADAWYEKARCYSIKGEKANAFQSLNRAVTFDPNLKAQAQRDPDFRWLSNDGQFKEITQ